MISKKLFIFTAIVITILAVVMGMMLADALQGEDILSRTGTVRVIGEQTHGLRNFASTDELRQWLVQDNTDTSITLKANKEGIINFEDICEQYALQLQNHALNDGFIMSFAIMNRIDYYNKFRKWLPAGTSHALNLVIIGNDVYFVEPQSDEYWQIAILD